MRKSAGKRMAPQETTSSEQEKQNNPGAVSNNGKGEQQEPVMPALVREYLKDKLKYELVGFITRGSTCAVYKLVDCNGSFFAAKVLDRSQLKPIVLNTLLPNELSIVREIHHPYIMSVYNVFSLPGYSVIVSEFAADGDLISYIENHAVPNIVMSKQWFSQTVQAIVYLHSKGIAHRDIKADNILLCSNVAKLADFGYATRCLDTKGQVILSTNFCGTMEYKAPEAIRCTKPYNPMMADCFSLGILLFVMVTHEFPFGSGNEIRTREGLLLHYEDITQKKWRPTGVIQTDLKLYCLLCQLLNPEVKERITARQALVQSWLVD